MAAEATKIPFVEGSAPATPAAGRSVIYVKSDGLFYSKDDAGSETLMSSGSSGNVATDAIWDAAGDLAVGTGANTAAKLTLGAVGGAVSRVNGAVAWNSGTSFPTAATGDRYYRSDLGAEFYYDGTRWLSMDLMSVAFYTNSQATDITFYIPLRSAYDIYVVDLISSTFVTPTNDGTKYWTVSLGKVTAANSETNLTSHNTSADTVTTWTPHSSAVNAVVATSGHKVMALTVAKTSTPSAIYSGLMVTYRRVAT